MTPKHDAETSTFNRVAAAEITSNRGKSLTSQTPTPLEPPKEEYKPETDPYQPENSSNRRTNAEKLRQFNSRSRSCSHSIRWFRRTVAVRRTPKNSVNSTPVPALVPAQYDGSGGPWQVRRSHEIFRQTTNAEKFRQFNYRSRS